MLTRGGGGSTELPTLNALAGQPSSDSRTSSDRTPGERQRVALAESYVSRRSTSSLLAHFSTRTIVQTNNGADDIPVFLSLH